MADIATFPVSMPPPLIDGYQEGGDDGVMRTQFDGGMKTRPKQSLVLSEVDCVLAVSQAQKQALDDFYWITLQRTGQFYWPDHARPLDSQNVAVYSFRNRPVYTARQSTRFRAALQLYRHTTVNGTFLLDFYDSTTWPTT